MDSITKFFCPEYMNSFFDEHLLKKNGGGRDRITPKEFYKKNKDSLPVTIDKCLNGNYNYTPYTEKLILKGRNKYPRVISIPTVRDRWVLGVLARYLQYVFPECVCHDLPNTFIYKIQQFIEKSRNQPLYYLQTDIESFYDRIDHDLLLRKIRIKEDNEAVLVLIERAIKNPTIPLISPKTRTKNKLGVPQGLAISNILAHIYMHDMDMELNNGPFEYFRYVDDILCIGNKRASLNKSYMKNILKEHELGLSLSLDKTHKGNLRTDRINYLGYTISGDTISIRQKNIDKYLNRLAAKCRTFRDGLENPEKRPRYMVENTPLFIGTFCHELDLMIGGAKYKSKLYGWLPYFKQMTNLSLLYRLDKILDKMLQRIDCFKEERPTTIKRFVTAYYRLKYNNGDGALFDYDNITSLEEKIAYLKKHGQIIDIENYSDNQIEVIFDKYIGKSLISLELDTGWGY